MNSAAASSATSVKTEVGNDKRIRNPNWTDHEIIRFLQMLEEDQSVMDLLAYRNKKVFSSIAQRLVQEGAEKTWDQCRIKLKNLKSQYRCVKERIPNIDELDLEDEGVVKNLVSECRAKTISLSCIKYLRFLLRFMEKHKRLSSAASSSGRESGRGRTQAENPDPGTEGSPRLPSHPPPPEQQTIPENPESKLTNGDAETQELNSSSSRAMENFNRDMMEHFLEYQRQTREGFAKWEGERWRLEKESIERWKQEVCEHEKKLFEMFCSAMVKCNATLTAILQASPVADSHLALASQDIRTRLESDDRDAWGDAPSDEDEDYEIQREIQNMVHVTMDVQDAEVSC